MLAAHDLKTWLHREIPRLDKLLLLLASAGSARELKDLRGLASEAGFKVPAKWNISDTLSKSGGKAIRTPKGWEITDTGKLHLRNLGVSNVSPAAMQVAVDLRAQLAKISDIQTKNFIEEAIACHEVQFYRSAIVMSWLGAMDVLHKHVHSNHLAAFNADANRVFGKKWKAAVTTDDLGRMSEADFLDRIAAISIIGKNVKTDLKACLDRRNACGHPNSFKVGANQSAAHIETLLLNVFERFA